MIGNVAMPLAASVISFVFALFVFDQYLHRRKVYQLVWTLGLLFYGVSAFTEYLGGARGWDDTLYRWWYLIGAVFVAAYLGMGTVYLLTPRRFAHVVMALLLLGSAYAAYKVFGAPVDLSLLPASSNEIVSGKGFPGEVRLLTPFFNLFGAGALVIGALYSAWVFWRRRIMPHRVVSNIFIAVGAFIPSTTGSLSRYGVTWPFFLGELLGVVVIFIGFLISIEVFEQFRVPFTKLTFGSRRPAA